MGLLDEELDLIVSNNSKLKWALCKFCRVPFLTKYNTNVCDRCSVYVSSNKNIQQKVMIAFIVFAVLNSVTNILTIYKLFPITSNYYVTSFISCIESFIIGYILWKLLIKFTT